MSHSSSRSQPPINYYTDTAPFWAATDRREYCLQRCRDTGRFQYPPRPVSMYTGRRNLEWVPVSGRGRLYAWTRTHSAWPGHEHRVPYLCALVELEEGVRVLANLVAGPGVALRAGMPLVLTWESLGDAQKPYPAFAPINTTSS